MQVTRWRFWVCLVVLHVFTSPGSFGATESKELVVAGDDSFPPYEFMDMVGGERTYRGFNADLLKAIALTTGYEIRFVPLSWSEAIKALDRGDVDAIGGMKYNRERQKHYDFSDAYLHNSLAIFVRNHTQTITSLDDLAGRTVAVQENDAAYNRLKNQPLRLLATFNQEEALERLLNGEVEAVLGNRLTGEYILQRLQRQDEVKIVGGQIDSERYGVAVRKSDPLLAVFNSGLRQIRENGTYDKLYEKWFGEMLGQPARYYKRNLWIAGGFGVLLLIAAVVVAVFNVSLKLEVRRRVKEIEEYNLRLRKSNEVIEGIRRYQNGLLNSGYGGMVTVDAEGTIRFANQYAQRYLGESDESLLGKAYRDTPLAEILGHSPASPKSESDVISMGEASIEYLIDELVLEGKKDTIVYFRDVTEARKLRQELAQKDKMEALGKLVASIAHEIRNPLASIKTFVELLPAKYDNPSFRQAISDHVPKEVERLDAIVTDLLAYSHPRIPVPETVRLKAQGNRTNAVVVNS